MNDILNPKNSDLKASNDQHESQFSSSGLYVKEDDQDWGSAGMNDIQENSE